MDFTQIWPFIKDGGLLGVVIWLLWEGSKSAKQREQDAKEERIRTFALLDKYGDALKSLEGRLAQLTQATEKTSDELRRLSDRIGGTK